MNIEPRLADNFGRKFPYLRLSLTDVCNFKCSYCLPDGYEKTSCSPFMHQDEIMRLVQAFVSLGVWKIRLTGGEPTVRKDFLDIARKISSVRGVAKLALTTNGFKLKEHAQGIYDAGIRAINISVDSLISEKFHAITGHNRLPDIIDGVDRCLQIGFETVKINTVLLNDLNHDELDDFIAYVADKPVSLRFIELMRTTGNQDYFNKHHLSGNFVIKRLMAQGWQRNIPESGAGPAQEFTHPNYSGAIGIIAPYSEDFCKSCNRLRVSAQGDLHLCLFGEGGFSLRPYLQSDDQQQELQYQILNRLNFKKLAHFLHDNNSGSRPHLASIGG